MSRDIHICDACRDGDHALHLDFEGEPWLCAKRGCLRPPPETGI
ncbi:MAG: hypothetical protein QM621_08190 [Aeromicrobium sp.]